jgi:hypothetical protein
VSSLQTSKKKQKGGKEKEEEGKREEIKKEERGWNVKGGKKGAHESHEIEVGGDGFFFPRR